MKKLTEMTLFFGGDPDKEYPTKIYFSYYIKNENAKSKQKILELDADDTDTQTMQQVWNIAISEANKKEGI